MSKKPRNSKDYTAVEERPRKRGPKENELRKNAPVKQIERKQVTTVEPAVYTAPRRDLTSGELRRKARTAGLMGRVEYFQHNPHLLRVIAFADGRIKGRSKRGWTTPSPAEVARREAEVARAEWAKAQALAKSARTATRAALLGLLAAPSPAPETLEKATADYLTAFGYEEIPNGLLAELPAADAQGTDELAAL